MSAGKRLPTVLQIIPHLETGGAELAVVEISEALSRADARAIAVSEGGEMVAQVEQAGATHIRFPAATKNPWRIFANGRRLAALIEHKGVDLVHARSRAPAWSALLAARRAKIPFVTTYHGAYGEARLEPMKSLKNLYNSVMARGDRVIANSHFTASLVRARHAPDEKRMRVVHRGVDIDRFSRKAVGGDRVEALRQAWGITGGEKIILQAARLTAWKGQSVLIDAAAALKARGKLQHVHVILAGADQGRSGYVDTLKAQIAARGLDREVHLVGNCRDMAAAFKLAHVTVVASTARPEAFGRTAAEAQALGCPVIATNIGAPPEIVRDAGRFGAEHATGWLVPPGDPDMLSEVLEAALSLDETALKELRRRARANIEDSFSSERMKRETLRIYDELLATNLVKLFDAA